MQKTKLAADKKLYGLTSSQVVLLWAQFFSVEPKKVREVNILGFYVYIKRGNPQAMEKAYNKLLETNDSLRLRFVKTGVFKFQQYIEDVAYRKLKTVQVADKAGFDRYVSEKFTSPTTIVDTDMTYAECISVGNEGCAIAFRIHHLALDGYSIALVHDRFVEYYHSYLKGEEPEAKSYSITDYFSTEREYSQSDNMTQDHAYWQKAYTKQPHYSFPAGYRSELGQCDFVMGSVQGALYQKLVQLAKSIGSSIPSISMALAALCVYRLTGRDNFCIFSPVHGRYTLTARRTVGCMMNTFPTFYYIDAQKKIVDFLSDSQLNFLEALKHSRYPMSRQTPLSYTEAFKHLLNFNPAWLIFSSMNYGEAFAKSPYEAKMIPRHNMPHQFYNSFLEVPGERIDMMLGYQTHKYSQKQAAYFMDAYIKLIDDALANPDALCGTLSSADKRGLFVRRPVDANAYIK